MTYEKYNDFGQNMFSLMNIKCAYPKEQWFFFANISSPAY